MMVGLSGGKDSWALLNILDVLRRAPIQFSLVAVCVDSGYEGSGTISSPSTCDERGWEYRIEHTEIGEVMDDLLNGATPCSLCARLRRGVLYRLANEVGATKIALGHHLDDFIETLLLNLFFAGALKAMPARLVSDNGEHVVIRPLVYVTEAEARNYAKEETLPIVSCCCPAISESLHFTDQPSLTRAAFRPKRVAFLCRTRAISRHAPRAVGALDPAEQPAIPHRGMDQAVRSRSQSEAPVFPHRTMRLDRSNCRRQLSSARPVGPRKG